MEKEHFTPLQARIRSIRVNEAGTTTTGKAYEKSYTVYLGEDSIFDTIRPATILISKQVNSTLFNLFEKLKVTGTTDKYCDLNSTEKKMTTVTETDNNGNEVVKEKEIEVPVLNENILTLGTGRCYEGVVGASRGIIMAEMPLCDEDPTKEFYLLEEGQIRKNQYGIPIKATTIRVATTVVFRKDMNGETRWTPTMGESVTDALKFERNQQLSRFMECQQTSQVLSGQTTDNANNENVTEDNPLQL